MSALTQQHVAEIIPFSRLAARMERRVADKFDKFRPLSRPGQALPHIEWGSSHYHDAAIAEERLAPHATGLDR